MPLAEQISQFCNIALCVLPVKVPLNHLAFLLPALHPHLYERYMGSAFAVTATYLQRPGLTSLQAFSIWDCHIYCSHQGSL